MSDLIYTAEGISGKLRLSEYLKSKLKLSSSLVTKVKFGGVRLNGEIVTMRASVKNGDIIEVTFPRETSESIEPADVPLDIVFEDDFLIIVNKPRNMPTHPSRGNHLVTLANAVMGYMGGTFVFRAVTRLDRDTSGLVLIAKNPLVSARLCEDMKLGKIKKEYTALVCGIPGSEGVIDAPIERECEGNIKRCVRADGKRAVTEYKITRVTADGNSICKVTPLTGRTHQIRVHFAYIGHPLTGDFLYGERGEESYKLACTGLEFTHPMTGENMNIKIDAPF